MIQCEISCEIPNLQTTYSGHPYFIEENILKNQCQIEAWFRKKWQNLTPPVYSSVDLRNSGFKIAPIDTNLFPAGFNNISHSSIPLAVQAAQSMFEEQFQGCLRILIIPESHTRNLFYLESLKTLQDILVMAGFQVRIGSLLPDLIEPKTILLSSKREIILEPLERKGNRVGVRNFDACLILLNHDLSEGAPEILQGVEQEIVPPLKAGWSHRLKSQHFQHYNHVSKEFSELIGLDNWLLNPLFSASAEINFMSHEGEEQLIEQAAILYEQIAKRYKENKISLSPYLVVKADAGTYGMGVMTIKHPSELRELNRRERTKMSTSKGGQKITRVIIQEGVYTCETIGINQAVAEPVVYMIGKNVVGGFYRVHRDKKCDENLNAPGMEFEPLAFCNSCNCPEVQKSPQHAQNRFYVYGVIARLAALAAAHELKDLSV